ncbi:MAG: homoserine kinase [Gemmatirosa sp.]|nr:homoserine kinase [Gemmatirosa sp.]
MPNKTAHVRVPCSTSNLGAGFDCVGIALDRWLDASVTSDPARPGITVARAGTLTALGALSLGGDHLVTGFARACRAAGVAPPDDLAFEVRSEIPVARGLGSSAASLVAGAMLADALLGLGLAAEALVSIVVAVDGHPDNAAPIVLGGAVLAVPSPHGRGHAFSTLDVHPSLAFAIAVPDFETSTQTARAVLPLGVSYRDAVAAVGKAAALVRGLATGDGTLLAHALDDVLHVPYRRSLVRGYDAVVDAARGAGALGASLSGSGSTVLAVTRPADAPAVAAAMAGAWHALGVPADGFVARIAEGARAV